MFTVELDNALLKGYRLIGAAQFDSAIIYFNQLKDHFKDPLEKIIVDLEIAWSLEQKGNYEESQEEFLRILENLLLLSETKYDKSYVEKTVILTYQGLTTIDTRLENIESAFLWAQKAVVESVITKDKYLIATSNYYLALVHYYTGQFDKIFELLDQSVEVIKKTSDQRVYGSVLQLYGISYQMNGDLDTSLKYYNECLTFYENLGDLGNISKCLNNMSIVYRLKGEYQISLRLLKKVEVMAEDQGRSLIGYHVVDNITEILLLTGEINAARESAKKLVQMARDNHYQNFIGKALGILAQIEQHTNLQIAKDLFDEAIILLQTSEIELDLIECVNRYLKFLIKIEDFDNTLYLLNKYEKIIDDRQLFLYKSDFLLIRGLIESNQNFNLGLAKNFYQQSLENANNSQLYTSKIKAFMYLAETEIECYQIRQNFEFLQTAKEYISNGYELALTRNLYPDIASINLIRSLVAQLTDEIDVALKIMEDTLALTRNKGLKLQEAQARAIYFKLLSHKQKSHLKSNQYVSEFDSTRAMISTIRIFYHEDFSHIMPSENQIAVVLYFLTEYGPVSKLEDFSTVAMKMYNLSKASIEEILLLMGSSFSIAVGQGNNYQEGLFGPLPVPRIQSNYALVFSKKLNKIKVNSQTKDDSEDHEQFGILCFLYPKEFDILFFDRELLNNEFSYFMEELSLELITNNLSKWKNQLLKSVQTNFLSHK